MKMLTVFNFWSNVDSLLLAKGLTLKDLCKLSDTPYRTLTTQRSRQSYPKAEMLHAIAEALKVSVDYLMTGDEQKAPYTSRSMMIAKACETADDYVLDAVELLLGIKKRSQADTLPREDAG